MPTIEISEESLAKIKEQLGVDSFKEINTYEDLVGEKYLFRTVTYHSVGEVVKVVGRFLYLKNASWIADSGRFHDFLKNGVQDNSEIEPTGYAFINMDTVVDFFPWKHALPNKQK